jgi:glycosyltransferase involved in cell wall biosynthesis
MSLFAISVVIRTCNSAKTLEKVIFGLARGAADEIIVVDSGSKDSTLTIAQKHQASVVIAKGTFNYSKSLNLGFAAAKNPWVLVISSHAIPTVPQFLEIHRAAIKQFPADVVVGYAPGDMDIEIQSSKGVEKIEFYSKKDWQKINQICGNANTIYRRTAWQELQFDETIRTAEDKIWFIEMAKRNYRFASIPGARALNQNNGSLGYMFRKGFSDRKAFGMWMNKERFQGLEGVETFETKVSKSMTFWQLGGAFKQNLKLQYSGRINLGNWMRCNAHILGQFFGSHQKNDNTPCK